MVELRLPVIDDRSYEALLADALARIPVHNPEWTAFNEADPGITVLELFSFMTETLLYRAQLIPERNRLAFLRLLGVETRGATAATGVVQLTNRRGPLRPLTVGAGTTINAGSVPFRTSNAVSVLPVEVRAYLKRSAAIASADEAKVRAEYELYYSSFLGGGDADLQFYETSEVVWPRPGEPPVTLADSVDGSLWLCVMARPGDDVDAARAAIGGGVMTLGVVPALDETTRRVRAGDGSAPGAPRLEVHRPDLSEPLSADPAQRRATYAAVEQLASGDVLRHPGLVQVRLPDTTDLRTWSLEATETGVGAFPPALDGADADRVVTWLRVRPQGGEGAAAGQADVRLAWLGANATMVVQRSHVAAEALGVGSGEPDQRFQLANRPVLVETLEVHVGGERWRRVDDLLSAAPEVPLGAASGTASPRDEQESRVYTVDRDEGWVAFGTGIHGARPAAGEQVTARYDFGGGTAGMVGPGSISKGPTLPPGVTVANPLSTWGGTEAASVEEAEAAVPRFVRTRGQLVSEDDFRHEAWQTPGIRLGRVDVLPLYFPGLEDVTVPGVVTLMVVPAWDPLHPDAPRPDRLFLDALCAHLSPKRLVTTELLLNGPVYKPVWVSVGVDVDRGRDIAPVLDAVKTRIRQFLSPLPVPDVNPEGWPLRTAVDRLQVVTEVARVGGVDRVVEVVVAGSGGPAESVPMQGLELPELVAVSVSAGNAASVLPTSEPRRDLLAVPFVPEEC